MYSVLYKKNVFLTHVFRLMYFRMVDYLLLSFFHGIELYIILYIELYIFKDVAYSGFDLSNSNYYEEQCHE